MSTTNANVRRIESTSEANLEANLVTKQLGYSTVAQKLGYKSSSGQMHYFNEEGSDASFNSLNLSGFLGAAGSLAITTAGEVVIAVAEDIANAVTASTGAIEFVVGITINADTTKFDVGAVSCYFSDSTDPLAPIVQFKEFPASTANALDNIAGQNATYIAINVSGVIVQQGTPFTPTQCRSVVPLGIVIHSNRTSINAINNAVHIVTSPANQISDLMDSIGTFNIDGNIFNYNGANLNINKTSGNIFKNGANFVTDPNDPHTVNLGVLTAPTTLRYRTQLGAETADRATIIPGSYDLNGVVTPVGATKFTIQHISIFQSNLVRAQYGQTIYNSMDAAKAAIATDPFVVEENIAANGLLRGLLIVKGNATDLSNPAQAFFMEVGKFGAVIPIGGGSSATVVSLQNAYDNSTTPEIVTSNTLGALTLANGQTLDTANQLEIKNLASSTTMSIDGKGEIRHTNGSALVAKMGTDPEYAPYIYFGIDDGTTTRRGLTVGPYATFLYGALAGTTRIIHPTGTSRNSVINFNDDENIYYSTKTDVGAWSSTLGDHRFWGSAAFSRTLGTPSIVIEPNTGIDLDLALKYNINGVQHVHENNMAYTGFDSNDVNVSYDYASRVVTLSGTAKMYFRGVLILDLSLGNHVSVARPLGDTNGTYYYYYNGSAYVWSSVIWTFDMAQIAYVYQKVMWTWCIRETHGAQMDWVSHQEFHETIGAYRRGTGGQLDPATYVINSSTAANRRPGVTATVVVDEDLSTSITSVVDGGDSTFYSVHRVAAGNATTVNVVCPDIVETAGGVGTRPMINDPIAGTLAELSVGQYMNVWLMAMPVASDAISQRVRYMWVNGQLASSTRATIDAQTPSTLILGDMDGGASQEYVYLSRILIRYVSTNTWVIISVNNLTGTKMSQVSTSVSSSTTTLSNLVTGGESLIPVGAASGHTVFDGATTAQLSFDSVNGLLSYNSAPECFTAFKPIWTPGVGVSQVGIGFAMYNAAYSTKFNYAGVYGEIVDNTIGSEDGAIVFKATMGGVLTEQFRAYNGKVGMGTDTPAFDLHILKADNTANGVSLKVENSTNDTTAYSYIETKAGSTAAAQCAIMSFSPLWTANTTANQPSSTHIRATGLGGLSISTASSTGIMRFYAGGTDQGDEAMRITPAAHVGMGCDPSVDLHVEKSRNGIVEIMSSNLTSGTIASAIVRAKSDSVDLVLEAYSSGYTTSTTGGSRPNSGLMYCNGSAGLAITGTGGIRMYSGGNADANLALTIATTGKVITTASTAARAGFNIPTGVVPTSPIEGDMWRADAFTLNIRSSSTNQSFAFLGSTQTWTAAQTFQAGTNLYVDIVRGITLRAAGVPSATGDFAHSTAKTSFVGFGGTAGAVGAFNRTFVSMYGDATAISNTTTPTSLFASGTVIGSWTTVANSGSIGKNMHIVAAGTCAVAAGETITFALNHGANNLDTLVTATLGTFSTTPWQYTADISFTTATAVKVVTTLTFGGTTSTVVSHYGGGTWLATAALLDVKITHSAANLGNTIVCRLAKAIEQ